MFNMKSRIFLPVFAIIVAYGTAWCGVDVRVNQDGGTTVQNEPSIVVNPYFTSDSLNVIAAYNDIGNTLGVSYSTNGGAKWFDVNLPYVWQITGDPSVACDPVGNAYACFLSYEGPFFYGASGIFVSKSTDGGRTWGTPAKVDSLKYAGGSQVNFADKCFMQVDTNMFSSHVGNIYVGWQRDDTLGQNSDVYFSRSTDGGLTFSTPLKINDNPVWTAYAEGAFPFVGANGLVYMTWYDCYFKGGVPGSLYVDMSFDGGQTFGADKKVANFLAPPHTTCDCTGFRAKCFPSAAADPYDMQKLYITYISDPDGYMDVRVDVGDDPGQSHADRPEVERNGSYVYAAWEDHRGAGGAGDIYFNRSTDNGQTWGLTSIGPLDNTDSPGANNSWLVNMSSSGSNIYVVWDDYRSGSHADIYCNRSSDNGATWQNDVNIDGDPTTISSGAHVVSTGNYVYVAYSDFRSGGSDDIYLSRSTNAGASWLAPVRVDLGDSPGANSSTNARLACIGSYVYCVWIDNRNGGNFQPYFNYSSNYGASWQSVSTPLSPGTATFTNLALRDGIECTGSNVYVCYTDDRAGGGTSNVYFNRSTNNGVTWAGDVLINDSGSNCYDVSLDMQGSYVYLGWSDDRMTGGFSYEIFFDYSSDFGVTWQTPDIGPLDIGAIGMQSYGVTIKSDNNYVYATWFDSRFGGSVFFNKSTDNGQTWVAESHINPGTMPFGLGIASPVMDAGNGWVNIVWPDSRCVYMGGGLQDIFTNYSSDNGATWLNGIDEADVFCVRSTDAGVTWQAPVKVSDNPEQYPDLLPWVAVKSDGKVDIAYYRMQTSSINPVVPGAYCMMAVSTDGGASFGPSTYVQDLEVPPQTAWVGEYIGVSVKDSIAFVVFTDFQQTGNSDVYFDRFINPSSGAYTCGDADASGGVDIDDVVYIITYIFGGGPAPIPLASGDADCSGGVDIDDVVYVITYIFGGGPPPCDPDGDGTPDC
jgi:hypothetical protein